MVSTEQLCLGQQQQHHLIILLGCSQLTIIVYIQPSVVCPLRWELRTSSVRDSHSTDYKSDSLFLSLSLSLLQSPPPHHPCTSHFSLDHNFLSDSVYLLTHWLTHIHICNIWQRFSNKDCSLVWTKWMINWVSVPAVFVPIWRYLTFSLNFIMDCLSLDIEESWSHESPLR